MALPLRRSGDIGIDLLRDKFRAAWSRSDEIFAIVPSGQLLAQPIVWRHPFIFYIGHLPAFSCNQICGGVLNWPSCNPYFDDLFCRGIDPDVDTGECHWHPEVPEEWPDLAETFAYRDQVREAILQALDALEDSPSGSVMARDGRVFQMVLEHEFMHQETLLYMFQQLPITEKRRPAASLRYSFHPVAECRVVRVPPGRARVGARFDDVAFGWDNEFSETSLEVPAFGIDSLPVTNAQYFEFVKCGAYDDERHWSAPDWRWKKLENKRHPSCWQVQDGVWCYRAMFDVFPLQRAAHWPVY